MIPADVPPTPPKRRRLWLWILLSAVAVAYVIFVARYGATWAGGADSSGYLNSTRILLKGEIRETISFLPGFSPPNWSVLYYQPLGYLVTADQSGTWMAPTYPIGLPLHYVLASYAVGIGQAPALINVLIALISAATLASFGRKLGLSWGWALGGVAVLWTCPLFVMFLLQPMSDNLALMWSLVAVAVAWHSREKPNWAYGAGLAIAIAVLVRPTDVLILPAVLVALGLNWKNWMRCALGGLPCAVFLLSYNHFLYGGAFTTGYGSKIGTSFSPAFALLSAPHMLYWVPILLSPVVVLLALFGLWALRQRLPLLLVLLAWFASTVGCYLFYYHTHETWWYLRFILPAFPAIILLGLFGGQKIFEKIRLPKPRNLAISVLFIVTIIWQLAWAEYLHITSVKPEDRTYPTITAWANENLPANALLLQMQTSGAFQFYTHFTMLRWDMISPGDLVDLEKVAASLNRPIYAVLHDSEIALFTAKYSGRWEKITQQRQASVWKLVEPAGASSQP